MRAIKYPKVAALIALFLGVAAEFSVGPIAVGDGIADEYQPYLVVLLLVAYLWNTISFFSLLRTLRLGRTSWRKWQWNLDVAVALVLNLSALVIIVYVTAALVFGAAIGFSSGLVFAGCGFVLGSLVQTGAIGMELLVVLIQRQFRVAALNSDTDVALALFWLNSLLVFVASCFLGVAATTFTF